MVEMWQTHSKSLMHLLIFICAILLVPNGIPGKVQDLKVFLIENTLRVFWSAPCTGVPLTVRRLVQ